MGVLEMEPQLATIVSGGPQAGPGTEPTVVIDLLAEGHAIEKDPTSAATIVAAGAAAEAIMERMAGSPEGAIGEEGQIGKRFVPYALIGDPEEIWGGISIGGETPESLEAASDFVRRLIGSVERPSEEQPVNSIADETPSTNPEKLISGEQTQMLGRGRNLLLALRQSRAAKVVATAGVVAVGVLRSASLASGETLEQECIDAGMQPYKLTVNRVSSVHRQHGNGWVGHVNANIDAMPSECADNGYYRVLNHRALEENGKHRAQWRSVVPWEGNDWNGQNTGNGIISNDAGANIPFGFTNIGYQHNHHWTKYQYICSPGPKKTGWEFQAMNTVIHTGGTVSDYGSKVTGDIQIVGPRKITTYRMQVPGAC